MNELHYSAAVLEYSVSDGSWYLYNNKYINRKILAHDESIIDFCESKIKEAE